MNTLFYICKNKIKTALFLALALSCYINSAYSQTNVLLIAEELALVPEIIKGVTPLGGVSTGSFEEIAKIDAATSQIGAINAVTDKIVKDVEKMKIGKKEINQALLSKFKGPFKRRDFLNYLFLNEGVLKLIGGGGFLRGALLVYSLGWRSFLVNDRTETRIQAQNLLEKGRGLMAEDKALLTSYATTSLGNYQSLLERSRERGEQLQQFFEEIINGRSYGGNPNAILMSTVTDGNTIAIRADKDTLHKQKLARQSLTKINQYNEKLDYLSTCNIPSLDNKTNSATCERPTLTSVSSTAY